MKRSTAACLAAFAALATVAPAFAATSSSALPAVTKVINGNSALAFVVRNITQAGDIFNSLARKVSPDWVAQPPSVMFKQMGSVKGINYSGSAAVVMPQFPMVQQMQAMQGPPAALVVPVTNADAFLAPLHPGKPQGGIITVHPRGAPVSIFAVKTGHFVALCLSAKVAKSFLDMKTSLAVAMAPALQTHCVQKAAFLFMRGSAIGSPLVKDIVFGRKQARQMQIQMQAQMAQMQAGNGAAVKAKAKKKPTPHYSNKARFRLILALVRKGLSGIPQAVITMNAAHSGLQLQIRMLVKHGSALARVAAGSKPLNNRPLAGLPVAQYLGAGAFTMNGAVAAREVSAVNAALLKRHKPWAGAKFESVTFKKLMARLALLGNQRAVVADSSAGGGANYGIVIAASPHPRQLANLPIGHQYRQLPEKVRAGGAAFTGFRRAGQTRPTGPTSNAGTSGAPNTNYSAVVKHQMLLVMHRTPAQLGPIVKRIRAGSDALDRRLKIYAAGEKPLSHAWLVAYLAMDRWAAGSGAAAPSNGLAVGAPPAPVLVSANRSPKQIHIELDVPAAQVKDFLHFIAPSQNVLFGI